MNILARRLAAVAGAAVLGLGIAAPAHAQKYTHTDARGDVTASTCDSNGDNCTDKINSAATDLDVTRVVFTHTDRRVKISAAHVDLKAAGGKLYLVRIVTNEGLRRHYVLGVADGRVIARGTGLIRDRDGKMVSCSGVRHTIDYTANTVAISIPRSCLSAPRSVRLGYGTIDVTKDPTAYTSDDALVSGLTGSNSDVALSPAIKRA